MLGQISLFQTTKPKLKDRVTLQVAKVADIRRTLETRHYLKRARTGRQINYLVLIDGVVDGVITFSYPMMSAPLEGVPSDELLEFARLYLASNIPHSASCAIGKSLRRIKADWAATFPDAKPVRLIVSWSDTTRHTGTIYKAANFKWLRLSNGSSRGGNHSVNAKRGKRIMHNDMRHNKDCWIYWL